MNPSQQKIALFGGSFDPVHLGHLAVARAAAKRFGLARVYFVPTYVQPLKAQQPVTSFYHRFAMLALALQEEARFVPSLLESPEIVRASGQPASYSIDTVARMRARMRPSEQLYFLIGMDAFAHIAKWRSPVELLRSVEFIVASRPGFPLSELARALPEELRPEPAEVHAMANSGTIAHNGATIHLLPEVHQEVSATAIRQAARQEAARQGAELEKLLPRAVAEYIGKLKLYDEESGAELPRWL
jgi:nicotinate-nucleotide adenylyltransferase